MKPKIKMTCAKLQLHLLSFCLLCFSGKTRCDENGPAVVTVQQDSDAVLPCSLSTKENIESKLFDWKKTAEKDGKTKEVFFYDAGIHYNNGRGGQSEEFKSRVSHFPGELKHGNASIIIRNTRVADSGDYTCDFPRLQPRQTFHIKLVVGTCPKPNLKILASTKDGVLLQCDVQGAFPKPKVELKDSSGKILPAEEPQVTDRGGLYDIILQTTVTKTDNYSCVVTQEEICHQMSADTHVLVNEPVVVTVKEDGNALLPCSLSTKENIEQGYFYWYKVAQNNEKQKEVFLYENGKHSPNFGSQDDGFKGRVSHFQEELKHGNASIIIRNTKMADSGDYTCVFPDRQTFHIKLVDGVLKNRLNENIPGAAPKPVIRTLDETGNWRLLQCEVNGNPQPEVEWRDSAGNKLPAQKSQVSQRDGRFYVTLNTTVNKTNHYRCVATQKNISHQIYTETFVRMNGPAVISVYEGDAAPLPCSLSTKENIKSEMFEWKKDGQKVFLYDAGITYNKGRAGQSEEFKGRVFHFPHKLKHGDASITIRNTKLTDNGNYTCDFPHHQPCQTFHIELEVVETGNSGSGAHSSGSTPGWIVAVLCTVLFILFVVVVGGVVLAVLGAKGHITLTYNKGSPADHKEGSVVPLKSQPSRSQEAPDPET